MSNLTNGSFKLRLLCVVIATSGFSHQSIAQDAGIEEVVVTGVRASLEKSIDRKRNSNEFVEVVTSEDLGKFPDHNVAESLQRVTGVQISRGTNVSAGDNDGVGEGSEVSVRGTPPALNRATVNGQTISTTSVSGGSRSFNYNTISPELVESLEVFKTPSASHDEGSLGGTVNLKTRSPLNFKNRTAVVNIKQSFNKLRDDEGEDYSLLYTDSTTDSQGRELGVLVSYNNSEEPFRRDSLESFGYRYVGFDASTGKISDAGSPAQLTAPVDGVSYGYMPKDLRQNIRLEERERSGLNVVFQYRPTDNLDIKLDYLTTDLTRFEHASNSAYRFTDAPGGVGNTLIESAVLDGDNFVAVTNSTSDKSFHQRYFVALFDREYNYTTDAVNLSVDWTSEDWAVSARLGASEGEGMQDPALFATFGPKASSVSYDTRGVEFSTLSAILAGGGAVATPSDLVWQNLSRAVLQNTDEEEYAQLDFERSIDDSWITSVKFGAKYRDRTKKQYKAVDSVNTRTSKTCGDDAHSCTLADYIGDSTFPVDDFSVTGGMPSSWFLPSASMILEDYSYDADGELGTPVIRAKEDGISNWDVSEEITAAYAMATFATDKLRGNFGLRYVNTDQDGNSNTYDGAALIPLKDKRSYSEVLPSLNVVYVLGDDLLLRGGYAKVMSRPSFEQLTLGYNVNQGAQTATRGNPDLDPFLADQFDLSLEWYFNKGGLLSTAAFYKDVSSYVSSTQFSEVVPGFEVDDNGDAVQYLVTAPSNGEGATIQGLEFSYQQNFTQLPAPFDGVGTIFNYTMIDSSTGRDDPFGNELPLEGLSESSMNLVLFYEKEDFSGRVSYTDRDDFLLFTSSLGGLPIYHKAYSQVDASMSYQVGDTGLTLTAEAINLTNEKPVTFAGDESRIISYREFGRRYALGLRYKF